MSRYSVQPEGRKEERERGRKEGKNEGKGKEWRKGEDRGIQTLRESR